jgi:hypothetical protein
MKTDRLANFESSFALGQVLGQKYACLCAGKDFPTAARDLQQSLDLNLNG